MANMILAICRVPKEMSEAEITTLKESAATLRVDDPERFGFVADVLGVKEATVHGAYAQWRAEGLPEEEIEARAEELCEELVTRALTGAIDDLLVPLIPMSDDERKERGAYLPSDTIAQEFSGTLYLMSGAPTSGDPPTDSYDSVAALDESELVEGLCRGTDSEPEEAGATVLHLYMDHVWARRRGDEWIAECMIHSEDGSKDVSLVASEATEDGAREKLVGALEVMGVWTVHEDGYWGED